VPCEKERGKGGGRKSVHARFFALPFKEICGFVYCTVHFFCTVHCARPFFLCCLVCCKTTQCVSFSFFFSPLSTCPGRHVVGAKPFSRSPRGGREGASRDVTNRSFRPCFGEGRVRWPPRNIPSSINAHAKHLVFFFFAQPGGKGVVQLKGFWL